MELIRERVGRLERHAQTLLDSLLREQRRARQQPEPEEEGGGGDSEVRARRALLLVRWPCAGL